MSTGLQAYTDTVAYTHADHAQQLVYALCWGRSCAVERLVGCAGAAFNLPPCRTSACAMHHCLCDADVLHMPPTSASLENSQAEMS
jgi:hypothetical protein